MNDNLPYVKKDSFFSKIKNWFNKIFNKNLSEKVIIEDIDVKENESQKEKFVKGILLENNDETRYLQTKLKQNEIEISDLTDNQLDEMIKLYKSQINIKRKKLLEYRKTI